jgi:class 3 adenylate cyclase/CHASE1-domain containing sensor protein
MKGHFDDRDLVDQEPCTLEEGHRKPTTSRRSSTKTLRVARYLPVAAVLAVGVCLSFTAFFYVHRLEKARLAAEFGVLAAQPISAIQRQIQSDLGTVQSLVAFYDGSQHVERAEFRTFAASILAWHPGIKALEWVPRVPASERKKYEQRARQEGHPEFRITELSPQGEIVPAGSRAQYFPVYYVEPLKGNERALGFDLASDTTRFEALKAAREAKGMRATAAIALVQQPRDDRGFLMVAPVYRQGMSDVVHRRPSGALAGFVLAVFTVRDLADAAFAEAATSNFDLYIYDGALNNDEALIYASSTRGAHVSNQRVILSSLHSSGNVDVAGREWRIVVSPSDALRGDRHIWLPWAVLLAGLGVTACAAPIYHLRRQGSARLNELATSLNEKNQMLETLSLQLSRYLPAQLCQSIFAGKQDIAIAPKRKKVTVFFSDIEDFTAATGDLEPEDLTFLLNDYFTEMSAIAMKHGATIDKFVGDAMLMFFGDPETKGVKEDAMACVRMAIAMQRRMVDLRAKWHDMGYRRPFHMRVGINTGYCNVGNFGSNERMDYTIIGGEVNVAARLERSTKPDGITLTGETYALVKDQFDARPGEPIRLKGITREIRPYSVIYADEEADRDRQIIRAESDGMKVIVDLTNVDSRQRDQVAEQLDQIASRVRDHLAQTNCGGSSEDQEPKDSN